MPKVIIINIPMMYHCVLHVQSMLLTSVASTAFIFCNAVFGKAMFRNDQNFEFSFGLSSSCSFLSRMFFMFLYWIAKSCSVF